MERTADSADFFLNNMYLNCFWVAVLTTSVSKTMNDCYDVDSIKIKYKPKKSTRHQHSIYQSFTSRSNSIFRIIINIAN